jgi:hypothetical protein
MEASTMADQSSGPLGLPPTVWVVIIVGLAGALAATQHPFQDVRPGDPTTSAYRHAPSEDQDIEARQWEDPFSAVAIARRAATKSGSASSPPADDSHTTRRLNADRTKEPSDRTKDPAHLLVVGVMVPGAPYADDIETRRRTRYAILAGLYQEGYVPDDSEHIGFIFLPELSTEIPNAHNIAAYEWLHAENDWLHAEMSAHPARNPRILLLWLDQDGFRDRPLARFSLIVGDIAGDAPLDAVSAVIIGPADSAGLQAMSTELDQGPQNDCELIAATRRHISIYSPRATALDWLIVSDQVKSRYSDMANDQNADHFHDRCANVTLYRTVASDFTVVSALYKELQYRGVRNVGEIALVTERDTLYARLISRYFNNCEGTKRVKDRYTVTWSGEGEDAPSTDAADDKIQPQCFTYLRGLDGLAPPAPNSADTAQSSSDTKSATTPSAPPAPLAQESATGQGQFDYLRRLATTLASARDDPACGRVARILALGGEPGEGEHACGRNIKAIGVVGSDIYDKLLVLQALRPAFPRYIFFTTDLDARLTDGQNLQWTRGMIVGSSLGLSLRPELQQSVPPFRDSYQTATYYSTRQAVRQFIDAQAEPSEEQDKEARELAAIDLFWTGRPHVFEIGRTQAFDLSARKDSSSPCKKLRKCPSIAAWRQPPMWSTGSFSVYLMCAGVAMLMVCLAAGAAMGKTWIMSLASPTGALARKRLSAALGSLVIFACLAMIAWSILVHALIDGGRRIPTPIFSGASHWTAGIVEALSIVLVVTLVLRGQRVLGTNAAEMLRSFKIPRDAPTLIDKYRSWLTVSGNHRRWKERLWFPIRQLSGNKKDPLVRSAAEAATSAPTPLDEISELEALIGQYLYRGRWSARFLRVLILTVISSIVLVALEYLLMVFEFNLGISLVNGFALIDFHYVERGIENVISFINLLAIQFLIFWVADALFLTRSFALALAKDRSHWPDDVLKEKAQELGLCKSWTAMWLNLRLIAWRTGRVANLIWYPSIMIALMAGAALTVEFGELGFASNPIALVISAAFVIGAAVMLRRVAESWRNDVLFRLDDGRLRALGTPGANQQVPQLDCLSERVRALSEGAFAPYSQQPLVRAVLVPAITYGTTVGLQYLHING